MIASNSANALTATTPVTIVASEALVTRTITYTYDSLYRLTEADYSSGENFQYDYDAAGNMTALTTTLGSTVVTTKAYDAANRLITVTMDGVTRTLDWSDAGELLRDGTDTYTWDAAGRLASATVDGVTSYYAYLGNGARISTTMGNETTAYTLDLAAPLVQVLAARQGSTATAYLYGVARIGEDDGDWQYHLTDHLGSVRTLAGADGSVGATRAYRPYGTPLHTAGGAASRYGFTGEQTDASGLVYLRARMYAPSLEVFLSKDPWEGDVLNSQTLNGFNYVRGNPTNSVDPSGLCDVVGATDCERFVSQVQCIIEGVRDARECNIFLRLLTSEEEVVLDFLALYYSGIPFTWHGLYLPFIPQRSVFRPGDPDRWQVPAWDQQETPQFSWDHPINRSDFDLGQEMRVSYGFKRPYFEQTHHYFAFLKFAFHLGGPPVEWMHKQREISDQLKPAFNEWQKNFTKADYTEWYAWIYRESVYDLFIVDEAVKLARAVDIIGTDTVPSVLKSWCASSEADVWSLESKVNQFYFDFPKEYWPDEHFWPGR